MANKKINRPCRRKGEDLDTAIREIKKSSGRAFDPVLVGAFLKAPRNRRCHNPRQGGPA
jgi:HD-GYP domain-containing protein (c-di-GMP phosphodiesterase class II)